METGRQTRMEALEGKLAGIEEKLVESHDTTSRKLDQLKDQVWILFVCAQLLEKKI